MEEKVMQAKKRKREMKAFEFSLNRITEASELSLANLNRFKTQISKVIVRVLDESDKIFIDDYNIG